MTDKRHAPRQKSFLRGYVYFANSPSAFECLVRDISGTGARLKFIGSPPTTDSLELNIPIKGETFRAKVCWRQADEIGIAFITNVAADTSHSRDDELSVRVNQLEAEIAGLKLLIKRLQKNTDNLTDAA
jgi:hypothetical protein